MWLPDDRATYPMSPEVEDRVQKMEWTLYGLTGGNGLVGEMKAVRKELHEWREEERRRREKETQAEIARSQREAEDRKKDRRWRLVFGVSVVSAILIAAGILAQGLQ